MGAKRGEHRSPETEFKKGRKPSGKPFEKGQIAWNKGLKGFVKVSLETRAKLSLAHKGHKPYNAVPKEERICENCGKSFMVGGRLGHLDRRYCSRDCSSQNRPRPCEGKYSYSVGGYKLVRQNGKNHFEHRLIAEQMLGRPLKKSEVVHHINGVRDDNRKANLLLMTQTSHMKLVNYLADLWAKEHPDMIGNIAREYQITFSSGG